MDIASHCRKLAEHHAGSDLVDRLRATLDVQGRQRDALVQAAEKIESQSAMIAELAGDRDMLIKRICKLEMAIADDGELPPELQDPTMD